MKSILLSVKPNEVCEILNGEQTLIVRKRFPKDYVGWVYVYCCKKGDEMLTKPVYDDNLDIISKPTVLNGKVVARFYCETLHNTKLECSDINGLLKKFGNSPSFLKLSNLEIFDKPRELYSFISYHKPHYIIERVKGYCYIEL